MGRRPPPPRSEDLLRAAAVAGGAPQAIELSAADVASVRASLDEAAAADQNRVDQFGSGVAGLWNRWAFRAEIADVRRACARRDALVERLTQLAGVGGVGAPDPGAPARADLAPPELALIVHALALVRDRARPPHPTTQPPGSPPAPGDEAARRRDELLFARALAAWRACVGEDVVRLQFPFEPCDAL